ncbi:ribonuclease HII [Acaryochloris marina]|uniref:Ribonuclease HII n=1 Tax=Acaryochloris marina (strain MBIC 11017) TaxID=329726 RepID=RNH2_ACAM1|nr:ribonuclease HII [Acaryochloris marina]B0CAM1.1 RecName: Full=Ribonuclease HII; Short=RNase HII [Acaryochloris marina MBIC11017]ABW29087.1 ribonuclease HII [Acaryochloris marina MBIC11017]BDM78038.1 ribonuclease HII [Acaryochloris marina MBIC10699]
MDDASEQIAGVDEVGRGALFGPVVAATVILSDGAIEQLVAQGMTDSKKLSPQRRMILMNQIREVATGFRVGMASVYEIDRLNILQASLLAMRRAVLGLPSTPQLCLVDGNQRIPNLPVPQRTVVKGDQSEPEIAAASILAKVWRDQLIVRLDQRYPGYDLASNKGYGSAKHRQALRELGPTRQHRLSFAPCQASLLPD